MNCVYCGEFIEPMCGHECSVLNGRDEVINYINKMLGGNMITRCKFHCHSVTKRQHSNYNYETKANDLSFVFSAEMSPVMGNSEENKKFFASTPTGEFKVGTIREDVFEPGKDYYLDISLAE
jgi:hypothetical protein